ncbi:Homeobox-leucine zipper protein GLABRA 2, partial [Cucurbita argyrosperma subsp. argyrosperma]
MRADMSDNNNRLAFTEDFFSSPALSLTLAGIFRRGVAGEKGDVEMEEVDDGRDDMTTVVEVSSENSGPVRSRSEEDYDGGGVHEENDDGCHGKRRKKYHRHTNEQIREMEAEISKRKLDCPNCGTTDAGEDDIASTTTEQLRIKNASSKSRLSLNPCSDLKCSNSQIEKLRAALGKHRHAAASPSYSSENEQETNQSCLDYYTGIFGLEKSRIMEKVPQALEKLKTMAAAGDPLWVRRVETGREILNYDEYLKTFHLNNNSNHCWLKSHIEASRETVVVFMEPSRLKAATVDVICNGGVANWDGAVQLMFAEVQMLTPLVSTREMYFIRHCKQLDAERWAIILDVSIENVEDNNIDVSLVKYRKRPSGCIIKDESNGHCKVTMVEHLECQKNKVHYLFKSLVNNGGGFGAKRWMATLQLQCERLAFFMATNIPMKDSNASSYQTWTKVVGKTGEDIRVCSRKNLSDLGEPIGAILCAVSSLWLPVSPHLLFHFLRDQARRHQTIGSKESNSSMWILQDSSTNSSESMVVYSGVDVTGMQSVMTGCDSSSLTILPSGFSILPDGAVSRPPLLITRQKDDKTANTNGGVLLTAAVQILIDASPSAKPTMESVEY